MQGGRRGGREGEVERERGGGGRGRKREGGREGERGRGRLATINVRASAMEILLVFTIRYQPRQFPSP